MKPKVSVIVPCYNEEATIGSLLEAIADQAFPLNHIEVIIADGLSTDRTREVVEEFCASHPQLTIHLVENPKRIIPAAINTALDHATGEVIVRLDAHSIPHREYITRCLEVLEKTGAANVGGAWEIIPSRQSWIARAIAVAASHPMGAGDARYRYGGSPGEVTTVPFGAFRRDWIERVGRFNESLLTNEDYEYNHRIREAGGMIWFDPAIRSIYYARGDFGSLAGQYLRYGYWKAVMLLLYPSSIRWRQALPPLFVLIFISLILSAICFAPARILLALYAGAYFLSTFIAGMIEAIRRKDAGLIIGFPCALWIMHFTWGGAFLWSILSHFPWRRRGSR
jgi:succinoglycan biosynthesis protein ExoA